MAATMKALVKSNGSVAVTSIPEPRLSGDYDVIVQVMLAGLCRTDLYAAEGKIPTATSLVLGHEFSGLVTAVGPQTEGIKPGNRVAVNPLFPCFDCRQCLSGKTLSCQRSQFLGVDRDGCFAQFIKVPSHAVCSLPEATSFMAAAYAEPVAASLAVMKSGISQQQIGLIYGNNRFAQLMHKILSLKGFKNIAIYDPLAQGSTLEESAYDFVIETMVTTDALKNMIEAVQPGGKIVLKSRQHEPIMLKMNEVIKKEPVLHVVNYGSFTEAIELLATNQIVIEDLVDGVFKLEDFEEVIKRAKCREALKPFFAPWES